MKPKNESIYRRGGVLAFMAVVVAVYAQEFFYFLGPWLTWNNAFFFLAGGIVPLGGHRVAVLEQPAGGQPGAQALLSGPAGAAGFIDPFLSPVPGFMGLLVLPLVSQIVFSMPGLLAALFSTLLYVVTLAHIVAPYGWWAAFESSSAFLLHSCLWIAFSIIGQREAAPRRGGRGADGAAGGSQQEASRCRCAGWELAVARERNRLAREIHDGLGHYLTTIAVQLEAAQALLGGVALAGRGCDRKGGQTQPGGAGRRAPFGRRAPRRCAALTAVCINSNSWRWRTRSWWLRLPCVEPSANCLRQ